MTTHGGTSIKEALHIIAPMPANAIARPSSYSAETRRNICEEDGKYKKIMNRTNNGLERYNRHYNELFPNTPSLFEFCEVIEEESRRVARKLRDIDSGAVPRPTYKEVTVPKIPRAYTKWIEDNSD